MAGLKICQGRFLYWIMDVLIISDKLREKNKFNAVLVLHRSIIIHDFQQLFNSRHSGLILKLILNPCHNFLSDALEHFSERKDALFSTIICMLEKKHIPLCEG